MLYIGRRWIIRLASGLSAAMLALAGLAFLPSAAYADEGNPPPTPVATGGRIDSLLERCLEREREWLSTQAGNLARADEGVDTVSDWIDEARARGFDTAELEELLGEARAQLATAHSEHAAAADILAAHAGFDDGGSVIDREQARATCLDARQAMNDAHQALVEMRELAVEMRELVRDWWREHRPAWEGGN